MNLELVPPRPIRTKRIRRGTMVDIYALPEGGTLYVPMIPDWELEQSRRERAEGDAPRPHPQ